MARTKSIKFPNSLTEFEALLDKLQRPVSSVLLSTAALAIGTAANTKVKVVNTIYAYIEGVLVKKTTAEVILSGTVTNAKFNVFVITLAADGTLAASMGTEASTIGGVVFPTVASPLTVVGFVIVNPTGTGSFVGATTALDDATVAPNAVYINTPFPFLPGMEAI